MNNAYAYGYGLGMAMDANEIGTRNENVNKDPRLEARRIVLLTRLQAARSGGDKQKEAALVNEIGALNNGVLRDDAGNRIN